MSDSFILKDSGERQKFATGAQRDTQDGKGRYDLLSPIVNKRLAIIMEKGAKKYDDRNWEKGIPLSRFIDSAKRHLDQFIEGYKDEDHLGQAIWNLAGLMHTQEMIKRGLLTESLNDLPNYLPEETNEIIFKDIDKPNGLIPTTPLKIKGKTYAVFYKFDPDGVIYYLRNEEGKYFLLHAKNRDELIEFFKENTIE